MAEKAKAADIPGDRVDAWKKTHEQKELWMTPEDIDDLLRHGNVLYISHTTKDGWAMVTPMFYCMLGKDIYTSTVKGRSKEIAYRRDNRMSASVSREDLTLVKEQGLTIKGRAEIIEDKDIVSKVCRGYVDKYWKQFTPAEQENYFNTLYTKDRVAVKIVPVKIISWDIARMGKYQQEQQAKQQQKK
jgi:nitroimidazol reductase NimA-like FMN-containing flavoprotein (pyridoxamine 5'-phosphate oxidase superfamily)